MRALAGLVIVSMALPASAEGKDAVRMLNPWDGRPGMWLELELARDGLLAVTERPLLLEQIRLLEEELVDVRGANGKLRLALEDAEESSIRLRAELDASLTRESAAELELGQARRDRWLWAAGGAAAGAGIVALLVALVAG